MVIRKLFLVALAFIFIAGCSSDGDGGGADAAPCNGGTVCSEHDECSRGQYCASSGCCLDGCAFDDDCDSGTCNTDTHQCDGDPDGGMDGDDGADDGSDGGGDETPDGGDEVTDGGGDESPDGGGDEECPATYDRLLGEACDCSEQCTADNPYCFADLLNDVGGMYCTISFDTADCSGATCPENYVCNDFYTQADPPQPPFCQKCLGGPLDMGETCLCDSDCGTEGPDCFRPVTAAEDEPAVCTITGCTAGEGDECPGTMECTVSFDFVTQAAVNYCKPCDPGDHSLNDGDLCGCYKDCPVGSICSKEDLMSQDPPICIACLGGEPRGFGETCECNQDCGEEFPFCLLQAKYCSVLDCLADPSVCPAGSHCQDLFGFTSFCQKD